MMVGGEAASRILLEVMKGVTSSDADTPDEAEYRALIIQQVDQIHADGGTVELPNEWP